MVEDEGNAAGGEVAGPRLACEKTEARAATSRRRNMIEKNEKVRATRNKRDSELNSSGRNETKRRCRNSRYLSRGTRKKKQDRDITKKQRDPVSVRQTSRKKKKQNEKRRDKQFVFYRQGRLRPSSIPEGGEFYFHDIMVPPQRSTRIFFQNARGLSDKGGELATSMKDISEFKAAVICI